MIPGRSEGSDPQEEDAKDPDSSRTSPPASDVEDEATARDKPRNSPHRRNVSTDKILNV